MWKDNGRKLLCFNIPKHYNSPVAHGLESCCKSKGKEKMAVLRIQQVGDNKSHGVCIATYIIAAHILQADCLQDIKRLNKGVSKRLQREEMLFYDTMWYVCTQRV